MRISPSDAELIVESRDDPGAFRQLYDRWSRDGPGLRQATSVGRPVRMLRQQSSYVSVEMILSAQALSTGRKARIGARGHTNESLRMGERRDAIISFVIDVVD